MPRAAAIAPSNRLQPSGVPAVVSRAPATAADGVYVEWSSIDEDDGDERTIEEGPCHWARRGISLPDIGDDALLLIDTIGDPWVICW